MRLKTLILALLLVLSFVVPAEATEPMDALKKTISKVLSILRDPVYKDGTKYHEQREKLKEVIATIFDYHELSMRTLGVNWKKFSAPQQDEFSKAFADLLGSKYLDRIQSYANEEVVYLAQRDSSSGNVEIATKVVKDNKDISIAYRLAQTNGWRVYDVIVEGVSLVQNYRVQFQDMMVKGTPEELIVQVKKKAQEVDKGPKT